MIRETPQPLLAVLDGALLNTADGFKAFFKLYCDTMGPQPAFPRLILKVLALNQGPGRRFIQQLLERGRTRGARKVAELKGAGQLDPALDPDMVRIAFVSLLLAAWHDGTAPGSRQWRQWMARNQVLPAWTACTPPASPGRATV